MHAPVLRLIRACERSVRARRSGLQLLAVVSSSENTAANILDTIFSSKKDVSISNCPKERAGPSKRIGSFRCPSIEHRRSIGLANVLCSRIISSILPITRTNREAENSIWNSPPSFWGNCQEMDSTLCVPVVLDDTINAILVQYVVWNLEGTIFIAISSGQMQLGSPILKKLAFLPFSQGRG